MPKISIVIPIYNTEKYLCRCVDSILNQTFSDFELILVDDGSTDRSPEICDEYEKKDKRIKVLHRQNGGQSRARNAGIKISKGDYIGFVDSDDWIHPRMFEVLYSGLVDNSVDISVCDYKETSDEVEFEKIEDYTFSVKNGMDFYRTTKAVVVWNKLYSIKLFDEIEFPIGRIYDDLYISYKLLYKSGNIAICENKLYYYFVNPNGITKTEEQLKKSGNMEELRQKKDYFWKKRIDILTAYKEQMEFFKDKDANLYEQSSHDYFDYLKGLYCEIYSGKLPGVKDDGTIIGQIREEHSMFIENCNSKLSKIFFSAVIKGYLGKSIQRFVIAVLF